jgi:hypothetical protein
MSENRPASSRDANTPPTNTRAPATMTTMAIEFVNELVG